MLAGRYRLDRFLGRGGMGEVWQAVDERLHRRVAIKILLSNPLGDEQLGGQALVRFRREGEAAARLNHRNIVAVYDLGEHRELGSHGVERTCPFLVLEFLEGRDLKKMLHQKPHGLLVEEVLDYGAQACDGLAAAHAAGIVHRDIKPANLMLLADGTIKVCDFGIARLSDATALYSGNAKIGTLAYMAPEQFSTSGRIDHRADLYALGATLYHLLTGHPVFPADDPLALHPRTGTVCRPVRAPARGTGTRSMSSSLGTTVPARFKPQRGEAHKRPAVIALRGWCLNSPTPLRGWAGWCRRSSTSGAGSRDLAQSP